MAKPKVLVAFGSVTSASREAIKAQTSRRHWRILARVAPKITKVTMRVRGSIRCCTMLAVVATSTFSNLFFHNARIYRRHSLIKLTPQRRHPCTGLSLATTKISLKDW